MMVLNQNLKLSINNKEINIPKGSVIEIVGGCFITGNYIDIQFNDQIFRVNAGFLERALKT